MYRQSHMTLGLGAFGGVVLHLGGTGVAWSALLAATMVGILISLSRIGVELGLPHVGQLFDLLRGRPTGLAGITPCPHCGRAHA